MDKKDKYEIDSLLNSLKSEGPTSSQMHNWKTSVRYRVDQTRSGYVSRFLKFTVTLGLGVFIGFIMFSDKKIASEDFAEEDAAIEVIYSNLD